MKSGRPKNNDSFVQSRIKRTNENSRNQPTGSGQSSGASSSLSTDQKRALVRSRTLSSPSDSTVTKDSPTLAMVADRNWQKSANSKVTNSSVVFSFLHFLRICNPTLDEITFASFVRSFGFSGACWLAAKFELKCQRPLRAFSTMMYGPSVNNTKSFGGGLPQIGQQS